MPLKTPPPASCTKHSTSYNIEGKVRETIEWDFTVLISFQMRAGSLLVPLEEKSTNVKAMGWRRRFSMTGLE